MPQLQDLKQRLAAQAAKEIGQELKPAGVEQVIEALRELKPPRNRDHGPMIKRVGEAICEAMDRHGDGILDELVAAVSALELSPQVTVEAPSVTVEAPVINFPTEGPAMTVDVVARDGNDYLKRFIMRPYQAGDEIVDEETEAAPEPTYE